MTADEILVALAIKHEGNWDAIYADFKNRNMKELETYLKIAKKYNYQYITFFSDKYPDIIKQCCKPPFVLFYRGNIDLLQNVGKNVAVVGSRECTEYGAKMTDEIVRTVAKEYTIVSGMARGIDAIAHNAAIEVGGKTIAVLGGGVDYCYPPSNKSLYKEIVRNHLVISEYPGKTMPQPENFPFRNRIIAMISRGTIVTEAYQHSGTLTTVMFTLDYSRLLLCVPYPATADSECNRLISTGAYLIENGNDALEVLKNDIHLG